MAYGLHWEWRGFGELSQEVRSRVDKLKPLHSSPGKVVDRYLWFPACNINVKLRSFGGGETLKFKRLVERDDHLQLQLWMEKAEEDYVFPLARKGVEELSRAIRVDLSAEGDLASSSELLSVLQAATDEVQIVTVEKTRRSYVWISEDSAVLIDLVDVSSPEHTLTIGLEDLVGLNEFSSREKVIAARDTVAAARVDIGLPGGLETSSYLEALTRWAANQGVER